MTPIQKPEKINFRGKRWQSRIFRKIEAAGSAKKRSELIDELAKIPGEVTRHLISHFGGKCWYCERKLPISELVVEHFRPKKRVTGLRGHQGYWWLAANSKNFRISCKNCNCRWTNPDGVVAGKGNYFPVMPKSFRAFTRRHNLSHEKPLLYDPLVQRDCYGLTFFEDGTCNPSSSDHVEVSRAYSSIYLFNLNNPIFVDARKQLWGNITMIAKLAMAYRACEPDLYQNAIASIRRQANDCEVYTGSARCAVKHLNSTLGIGI